MLSQKQILDKLYKAQLETCAYCKASADTGQTTEHSCNAKPLVKITNWLMAEWGDESDLQREFDLMEIEKESFECEVEALRSALRDAVHEKNRYFDLKQDGAGRFAELRRRFDAIRIDQTPFTDALSFYERKLRNRVAGSRTDKARSMVLKAHEFAKRDLFKMHRWLGYVQCLLGPHGDEMFTLEELKAHNRGELPGDTSE